MLVFFFSALPSFFVSASKPISETTQVTKPSRHTVSPPKCKCAGSECLSRKSISGKKLNVAREGNSMDLALEYSTANRTKAYGRELEKSVDE